MQAEIAPCGEVYGSPTSGTLTVTNSTPSNGATSVSTATNITLTFNNAIDPATVNATTLPVLIANGINQQIAGSYQVTGNQIVFTPDSPFPTNTTIYVDSNYGPADLAGDLAGDNYTPLLVFTTGGTATPASAPFQVVTFSPAANATAVGLRAPVAATFNRSINLTSVNSGDFGLFAGDGQSPWCSNYQHSQDDATILFNCGVMPSSTLMTAQLGNGLTDWQGNGLVPYTSAFTTTYFDSNTNGSIISSQPGSGAGGVANNVPLVLYTNLPINSNTVSAGLQVAENGTPLPGSTEVIDNGYAMVFTPSANLTPGALIQWWTTGQSDGHHLQHLHQWRLRLLLCGRRHQHADPNRAGDLSGEWSRPHRAEHLLRRSVQHSAEFGDGQQHQHLSVRRKHRPDIWAAPTPCHNRTWFALCLRAISVPAGTSTCTSPPACKAPPANLPPSIAGMHTPARPWTARLRSSPARCRSTAPLASASTLLRE